MINGIKHKVLSLAYHPLLFGAMGLAAVVLLSLQLFIFAAPNSLVLITVIALVVISSVLQFSKHLASKRFQRHMMDTLSCLSHRQSCETLQPEAGLAYSFAAAEKLNEITHSISTMQDMVSDVTKHLSEQSAIVSNAASFVASQMPEQIAKSDEVVALVEKMQAAFGNTIGMANETVEITKKSENEGNSGKLVMTDAMSGISMLSQSVATTGGLVEQLGKESEEINGIINVIKGVAEQTNLLALNAAIEAARAGEQGRGFAVVADEVRTLAGKTQQHAAEIEAIIDRLVDNVRNTSNNVQEAVKLADSSDEAIEGVVMSYSEIVGYMLEISELSNNLSEVTQREKLSADDVFNKLHNIKDISQNSEQRIDLLRHAGLELESLGKQLDAIASQNDGGGDNEADEVELF